MLNLAKQITRAAAHAARLKQEMPAVRRARTSFTGVGQGTGLRAKILELLPVGVELAVTLAEMAALLEDFPHAYSGISSSLANLVKCGQAKHVGNKGAYRYYKESN